MRHDLWQSRCADQAALIQSIDADRLRLIAEVERLRARDDEWQQKAAAWMASPDAAQRLDGYRALGAEAERLSADLAFEKQLHKDAGAEVERLRAERQWQPMETAPRDGNPVLLWNGYGTLLGYWGHRANCWLGSAPGDNPQMEGVTHWLPLPKPPEQKP